MDLANWGQRVIGISRSLIWSKTLMVIIFNPCGGFLLSPEGPASQIHSPHFHDRVPGIFQIFKAFSDAKERVGCGKQGKLPHLSIPSKTATWTPEFAVEDLPLDRTATLVPEFAVKDLSLGITL